MRTPIESVSEDSARFRFANLCGSPNSGLCHHIRALGRASLVPGHEGWVACISIFMNPTVHEGQFRHDHEGGLPFNLQPSQRLGFPGPVRQKGQGSVPETGALTQLLADRRSTDLRLRHIRNNRVGLLRDANRGDTRPVMGPQNSKPSSSSTWQSRRSPIVLDPRNPGRHLRLTHSTGEEIRERLSDC